MTYRIHLRSGDTFETEDRPDVVELPPPDGRTVLRAIVGGRVVRRPLEAVRKVEATDEAREYHGVELEELRQVSGKVTEIENARGAETAPKPAEAPASSSSSEGEGEGGGSEEPKPEKLPEKKADLEALWRERHPDVDLPTNDKGRVTVASLKAALSAE